MDLYLDTTLSELVKIFKLLKFKVVEKNNYFSAARKTPQGRFHAMFTKLEDKIYCDFHFDHKKHFLFLAVDYARQPKEFFERKLAKTLENKNIKFGVKEVSWFTRRNKAVFGGFKL